jgi:hypothetical protein
MSVLLIVLVVYVFCLFLLHLVLFLRYKYREMLRERLKNERAVAAIDSYEANHRTDEDPTCRYSRHTSTIALSPPNGGGSHASSSLSSGVELLQLHTNNTTAVTASSSMSNLHDEAALG